MNRKILIVTDAPRGATALAVRIAALGYPFPSIVPTSGEMLLVVGALRPDLFVVDVAAGDASARRIADELVRAHPAPIVYTVSDGASVDAADGGARERDTVLTEPFTDRELALALELAFVRHDRAHYAVDLENRFFAVSIDMLCQLGFDGYFRRLNPSWERTLGFTIEELKSRPFIEFVHPDDRVRTLRQNREVRGGGQALGFENRYLCKDGSYRWLLWNAASDAENRVIYSVARDVTARRQAQDDRERLVAQLDDALAELKVLQALVPRMTTSP